MTAPAPNADLTSAPPGLEEPSSASARLRSRIDLVVELFGVAFTSLVHHPRVDQLFRRYLINTHSIIKATVPLFEATRDRARQLAADGDAVAAAVAEYMDEHIIEELHHDEWLLDDLEAIGMDRAGMGHELPPPSVAQLVGSQYYWVQHVHPVAILGYLAFMEGYPPTAELVDLLVERTGYPREAFRTYALHGELDPHHREEIDRVIDTLPLTEDQETLLGLVAMSGVVLLARTIEDALSSDRS
ncbi:MAG TPA: iron-containing redox enzyme family protein [Actinomycetota bacterium]|nr:iron-containing redox enzyme family protein [Actinomycetota bacterium]